MRFFEVPVAGGLQLSSSCPEQEPVFIQRKHIVYFHNEDEIVDQVRWILANGNASADIRAASKELVNNSQCYQHRFQYILNQLAI